jgi:2'-5' RNA ligase
MRLFVALHFESGIRDPLGAVLGSLRLEDSAHQVKWVDPAAIHLTLRFLGEVPEARVSELGQEFEAAIASRPAPVVALGRVGAFPDLRRPRVLWVGLATEGPALLDLQAAVEAVAVRAGWEPEGRPFQPHLTLGRVRTDQGGRAAKLEPGLLEALNRTRIEAGPPTPQTRVALVRSHLAPGGSRYEDLVRWDLRIT